MNLAEKALIEQPLGLDRGCVQKVMEVQRLPKKAPRDKLNRHGIYPERFR